LAGSVIFFPPLFVPPARIPSGHICEPLGEPFFFCTPEISFAHRFFTFPRSSSFPPSCTCPRPTPCEKDGSPLLFLFFLFPTPWHPFAIPHRPCSRRRIPPLYFSPRSISLFGLRSRGLQTFPPVTSLESPCASLFLAKFSRVISLASPLLRARPFFAYCFSVSPNKVQFLAAHHTTFSFPGRIAVFFPPLMSPLLEFELSYGTRSVVLPFLMISRCLPSSPKHDRPPRLPLNERDESSFPLGRPSPERM